jgi:hypothetical protein
VTPTVRYPAGPITPVGACHALDWNKPQMAYLSPDGSVVFHLLGPLSYFDNTAPEAIRVLPGMKGLVPPWKNVTQKGATQDGVTYVTSLYDPLEVEIPVLATGRDPAHTRRVIRAWIDSWDAKTPGELSWFTPQSGYWWANVRWAKNPGDPLQGGNFARQKFTWTGVAYDAFWRSYDSTDQFAFGFDTASDSFTTNYSSGLGSAWTLAYTNANGFIYTTNNSAVWSPSSTVTANTVVAQRTGYTSAGDNQVVTIDTGALPAWPWSFAGYDDIWVRMANTGTPGANGVRVRVGTNGLTLSSFNSGVETVLYTTTTASGAFSSPFTWIWPQAAETYTVIAGTANSPREFIVTRNGATIFDTVETGTTSRYGATFRGAGFGMAVGVDTTLFGGTGQGLPAAVNDWAAGDNVATATGPQLGSTGFITLANCGDQPMWPRYTCFGPGTFSVANGPANTDTVTFGPLLAGQVAQIQTDPRVRGVVDLTATAPQAPPTAQQQNLFTQLLSDFLGFLSNANAPSPSLSVFGVPAPQGNLYGLLSGRFSNPIPPKSPGGPATPYPVAVGITGGNAQSRILAAGTPLRRFPQ